LFIRITTTAFSIDKNLSVKRVTTIQGISTITIEVFMKNHERSFTPALTKLCVGLAVVGLVGCGGSSGGGTKKSSSAASVAPSSVVASVAPSSVAASSISSSSETPSSTSASSSSSANGWSLVWSDEFDGQSIDSTKWEHEVNCWGGGNEEKQCYTTQEKNSFVQNGSLHIVAVREADPFCGPSKNQEDPGYDPDDTSACKPYTSARLRTKNKADWTYGRMEIRAKMPFGKALWPAIWMLPTDYEYGSWPHSGEIDIFEAFSPGTTAFGELNEVAGTLHYGFSWPWNQYTGKDNTGKAAYIPEENIWDEFHTYAVEWEEEEIRWYVDGHHYGTQNSNGWFSYYWGGQQLGYQNSIGKQPFDKDFHMLLNVAVGSSFLGEPDQDAVFPQTMEVQFVRVYECSVNPETGKGCGAINPDVTPVAGHTPPPNTREEVYLYQNGVKTLTFNVNGNAVNNTLVPAFWELAGGNVVSTPAFDAGTDGIVWDIDFNGVGNAFLSSGDMSQVAGVANGFNFGDSTNGRAKNVGELKFDLKVLDIDPGTKLQIKLDSGYPNLSYHEIEIPVTGVWEEVAVRFYTLNGNNGSAVDFKKVLNPFVVEPVGGKAHIQLNNIRVSCLKDAAGGCGVDAVRVIPPLQDTFDVFIDSVDALWDRGVTKWDNSSNSIQTTIVDSGDVAHGQVINIAYGATSGIAYIQSSTPKNASAFADDGHIEFDVKVTNYGTADQLLLRVDCVNPCKTADIPLGKVGDGVWQKVTVDVSTFNSGGFNLANVDTPFIIFPTWDKQNGVTLQVDNIRWVKPQ
jgi:beta-glucanase (GH16 family)